MGDEGKMSFIEHLEELRKRLIKSAVAILVGMIVCWFFKDRILSFLLSPLYEAWANVDGLPAPGPLNFTDMLEPFIAYLKLSAVGGLFVGSPFVLYQLWKFVAPGLYPKERRLAMPFVFVSSVLFIGGAVMAYSFVFPFGFRFFLDLAAGQEMIDLEAKVAVIAGPEPVELKKNSPPPPTPSQKEIDAGPDNDAGAGVEQSPSSGPKEPARAESVRAESVVEKRETGSGGDAGTWFFERLLGYFGKEDCATFAVEPAGEQRGAKLVFTWNEMRCGERPELTKLTRDDEPIQLEWKESGASSLGEKRLEADDKAAPSGNRAYRLKIPADPHAMRLAPVLMVKDYLSLALKLLLAFGVVFELPILISFLAFAGIVNYKQLLKFSRWFIPISFIVSAMLTPPDALTQILLALPLIALYFLSVLVAYLFGERQKE